MRTSTALRTAAVGLALTLCGLLLGLSHAHNALPGDTFQVTGIGASTTGVHHLPAKPHDEPATAKPVALPDIIDVRPELQPAAGRRTARFIHCGRDAGAPGCRGPPAA